ncbi:MAG: tRNA (adenosine(37)-N6)-threonylcarbamoyltransferase complex dimerization subunit type 1 TsaB [Candidatus Sericytochromatia bacterium]
MLILGIDTTEKNINIALTLNKNILFESELISNRTEDIINHLRTAFLELGKTPTDLNAIGVILGPGGYTGTRSGIVVAKTMAQFINIPVIGFNKIDALLLAYNKNKKIKKISPNIDVKRNESYFCIANVNEGNISYLKEPSVLKIEDLSNEIQNNLDTIFLLKDFENKKNLFPETNNIDYNFYLKPSDIAFITQEYIEANKKITYFNDIKPFYIREAV